MPQDKVTLNITRADKQIVAYLNGYEIYKKSTDSEPVNDSIDITDQLGPNVNNLLLVGVNWGDSFSFAGNLDAYGKILDWSISEKTSLNGIVWYKRFEINAQPAAELTATAVNLIQNVGSNAFISGSVKIKNSSHKIINQNTSVFVDFYLSTTNENKDHLILIGNTELILQQDLPTNKSITFFMPDKIDPNRLTNISRIWAPKTIPPGDYYVYANLRQNNNDIHTGTFTNKASVTVMAAATCNYVTAL